jgi:hypothetical protein
MIPPLNNKLTIVCLWQMTDESCLQFISIRIDIDIDSGIGVGITQWFRIGGHGEGC